MNIIQIGCHIGNDHVYDLIKNTSNNNTIVLIDANPYSLEICKNAYTDLSNTNSVRFLNYAIVPSVTENTIKFYIPLDDKTSAHCSTSTDFLQKHNHKTWEEIDVPCKTINDIISEIQMDKIDKLFIDAEGLDAQIILSLDLNAIKIIDIVFEHTHSDGAFSHGSNLQEAVTKLRLHNYDLSSHDLYNIEFHKRI